MRRRIATALILAAALLAPARPCTALPLPEPAHGRPFFMPAAERDRILSLARTEEWARLEYQSLAEEAAAGKGYPAALLYAIEGTREHLETAKAWLLAYGRRGGDIHMASAKLKDPEFFKGGQPWISPVYYNIDFSPLVAFDLIHDGLSDEERKVIEDGIRTSARFRMKAMDRWTQTANLVFKPTVMVAVAGLALDDREMKEWGFRRKPGSPIGGYFEVLNVMLRDGGPWWEAPIYPVAHTDLLLMSRISRLLSLYEGGEWFARKAPSGGSPRGLMDYYIDSAYPVETAEDGARRIRIANYGDGATGPKGDLFLVPGGGDKLHLLKELAAAYGLTGDERYAAFLSMDPGYRPSLTGGRPLPEKVNFPAAPSKVWPTYGLAMLRSDGSPAYWTGGRSMAVFQIMSRGYGHDHRDKFGITLFGAGRLLYPDYNFVQYENPAEGWTRNTIAHNTLMVDEEEAKNAAMTAVRSDFTPAVKYLATSAEGVFEGVRQTRALFLTEDYLLDLFRASSAVPRTCDYLIHAFGAVREGKGRTFDPAVSIGGRFRRLREQRGMLTDGAWSVDFVQEDAGVRLTMAASPGTRAVQGRGPDGLAMLAARREEARDTVFTVLHEPYRSGEEPRVGGLSVVAEKEGALVVRIDRERSTDYIAAALDPSLEGRRIALAGGDESGSRFIFSGYGYLHVPRKGEALGRGGWVAFSIPEKMEGLRLNGESVRSSRGASETSFGAVPPPDRFPRPAEPEPEFPSPLRFDPGRPRLFPRDRKKVTAALANGTGEVIEGRIEFDLPAGITTDPPAPLFAALRPGEERTLHFEIQTSDPEERRHTIPYRVIYRSGSSGREIRTAPRALEITVGYVLEPDYRRGGDPVYAVSTPRLRAEMDMRHGAVRYLADDAGRVRLDGEFLFTFGDGSRELLTPGAKHAFTWPVASPASLTAHVEDRARYQVVYFADRLMVRMQGGWTRFPRTFFTVPGSWVSPEGAPRWGKVIGDGGERPLVAAAELAFPRSSSSLCFEFDPPQEVAFRDEGMAFSIGSLTGDSWTAGFCHAGGLASWRWKKAAPPRTAAGRFLEELKRFFRDWSAWP